MMNGNEFRKNREQIEQFKKQLYDVIGDSFRNPISARLGYQDDSGATLLKVPSERTDQPAKYYFHEAGGTSFQGEAFLQSGAMAAYQVRYNAPIRLLKDPLSGEWEIIGIDSRYAAQFFAGVAENNNIIYPYSNLAPGLLTQTEPPSMAAKVLGGHYRQGNTWKFHNTQQTINWGVAPYNTNVPTTNATARYVLVQIHFDTGELLYTYGDEISISLSNLQAYALNESRGDNSIYPAPNTDYLMTGFIRLVRGMTRITSSDHIWAAQEYLGGGSGSAAILDRIVTSGGEVVVSGGNVVYT